MIPPDSLASIFAIVAIIVFGGIVQSAIGFGYAIAILPLVAMVMDARSSHVLVSLTGVPVLAMSAWTCRQGFQCSMIWPALLGGCITIPLGIVVFVYLSADSLIRLTGSVILVLLVLDHRQPRQTRTPRQSQMGSFLAGSISGFLAGAVSIGGPPVATFALRQPWTPLQFKAFVVWFLLLTSIVKVVGLGTAGYLDWAGAGQAATISIFAVGGVIFGSRLDHQIEPKRFKQIIASILCVIAISMIIWGA